MSEGLFRKENAQKCYERALVLLDGGRLSFQKCMRQVALDLGTDVNWEEVREGTFKAFDERQLKHDGTPKDAANDDFEETCNRG